MLVPVGAQLRVRRPCPEKRCVWELGRTPPPERGGDSAKRRLCSSEPFSTHCSSLHGARVRAFHLRCPLWYGFGLAGRPGRTSVYPVSPHRLEALNMIGSFCRQGIPSGPPSAASVVDRGLVLPAVGTPSPRRLGCTKSPSPSVGSRGAVPCMRVTATLGNP